MDYKFGLNPYECKAVLPWPPIKLQVEDDVLQDDLFFTLTLADGRKLLLGMKANIPRCYGFFIIELTDSLGDVWCGDRRIVASLAAFIHRWCQSGERRISDKNVPILSREEADETWKRLEIPQKGPDKIEWLERAPRWPSCFLY